jgi:hypothetical protein
MIWRKQLNMRLREGGNLHRRENILEIDVGGSFIGDESIYKVLG